MTAGAIFDDVDRNGPFDSHGRPAIGLRSRRLSIDWQASETLPGSCSPKTLAIDLAIVVTLPQHDRRTNFRRTSPRTGSDSSRESSRVSTSRRHLSEQREDASLEAEMERAQEEFHIEDERKIRADRRPLQVAASIRRASNAAKSR